MNIMCKILTPYTCEQCKQDMIFFTTYYGTVIDYKGLMMKPNMSRENVKKYLENRNIKKFKCVVCNKEYIIDWTTAFPTPLYDDTVLEDFRV